MQKRDIRSLVLRAINDMGSSHAVAVRCDVSDATISLIRNERYDMISEVMWRRIAKALEYNPTGWQVVPTLNTKALWTIFDDAKQNSIFAAVSHQAGTGKTVSGRSYAEANAGKYVYYLQAREWNRKKFLMELARVLGVNIRTVVNSDELVEKIAYHFLQVADKKPLVIIDEADKLSPHALRAIIPIYNECEGILGLVMMGTDNLRTEIKRGVTYNKKGYDEIDSRLGRNFISLYGATKKDVEMICEANGVRDPATQAKIWAECEPVKVEVNGSFRPMVSDLRRVRRAILRELLQTT